MPEGAARARLTSHRPSHLSPQQSERLIRSLWLRFGRQRSDDLAWRLAECYLPLLRRHALCLRNRFPSNVQLEELESHGLLGLLDAIAAYDPTRHVKFETFSALRIRGAILDGVREADWVPRPVRAYQRQVERAQAALEAELGRRPSDFELMERLDPDPVKAAHIFSEAQVTGVLPLGDENRGGDDGEQPRGIGPAADPRAADPAREVLKKIIRETILRGLSKAERLVVLLYYYEQMTMREIAEVLDLSESRICQMHASILQRLRAVLDPDDFAE